MTPPPVRNGGESANSYRAYRHLTTQLNELANKYEIGENTLNAQTLYTNYIDIKLVMFLGICIERSIPITTEDKNNLLIAYRNFLYGVEWNNEMGAVTYMIPNSGVYELRVRFEVILHAFRTLHFF